jgi:hypothetical protein
MNNKKEEIQKIMNEREIKKQIRADRIDTGSIVSGRSRISEKSIGSLGGQYYNKYIKYKLKYLKLKKDL